MSKKHPFSCPERKDGGETNFKRDGFEDEDEDEDENESPNANAKEALKSNAGLATKVTKSAKGRRVNREWRE